MLAGLAPVRRRVVLAVLAVVVAAAGILVVALVSSSSGSPAGPVDQARTGPVVLVPGYGSAPNSLQPLADVLTAAGRDVTIVDLPGDGTGDLNASADALGRAADGARRRAGADSIDVVGYSMGGLVARLWVKAGDGDVVRRVVTLGSPHHGTSLADLAGDLAPQQCPLGCQQMTSGSALLAALNRGDETPAGPTWVSIWTTQDETVTPPDSARLEGALNLPVQSVCADAQVGHGDLPRDPLVQQMVVAELAPGGPPNLGPGDCARLGG